MASPNEAGSGTTRFPLKIVYEIAETDENVAKNVRRTFESGYRSFNELLAPPHDRVVSIAGFGPSLKRTYKNLDGDIWACNGAHDWLIEQGVIPKYAMYWDASPLLDKYIKPHKDVIYLVASRCHPNVFEALKGSNVYVWHPAGDPCIDPLLCEYRKMEPMIGGGSSATTRAMVVVTTMGYRKIKLFGSDGSYDGEHTHVNKSIVPEEELVVWCDGKDYTTTSWLAGQVEDFKYLSGALRSQGCEIEVYGDGLLPHVAMLNGFAVHNS